MDFDIVWLLVPFAGIIVAVFLAVRLARRRS